MKIKKRRYCQTIFSPLWLAQHGSCNFFFMAWEKASWGMEPAPGYCIWLL